MNYTVSKSGKPIGTVLNSDTKTQLLALSAQLGITGDDVCAAVGLTPDETRSDIAGERIEAVSNVCDSAWAWFDKPVELWRWFTSQSLRGFGGKTPAIIIQDYNGQGGDMLIQFLKSKELGSFE